MGPERDRSSLSKNSTGICSDNPLTPELQRQDKRLKLVLYQRHSRTLWKLLPLRSFGNCLLLQVHGGDGRFFTPILTRGGYGSQGRQFIVLFTFRNLGEGCTLLSDICLGS